MFKQIRTILFGAAGLFVLGLLLYQVPAIQSRVVWHFEVFTTYMQNTIHPIGKMPTPVIPTMAETVISSTRPPAVSSPTFAATETSTPTPVPLPAQVALPSPKYELQGINNCGPATLTMYLRMYGWSGNQNDIAQVIKPVPQDRNVNPDELVYFVRNKAGWLSADFRVGGDLTLLKSLLAAQFPVMIEEASKLNPQDAMGPDDDLWDGHYLLITGYDDTASVFTAQDPLRGPDQKIPYDKLMTDWKSFNYVYILVYPPDQQAQIQSILGSNWDPDQNRKNALAMAQAAASANPSDAFTWFNVGSNLVYFERYTEAAQAFDKAFEIGLPQRMTRYQFSPFFAYYYAGRIDYLVQLTEYTYKPIPGYYSEEALLWHGYALYKQGNIAGAKADWNKALSVHPNYCDAEYAINNYIQATYNLSTCVP